MSRSNPTLENPAHRFFSWKGSTGKLVWYDKENKTEVEVKLPFAFMVLDQLATITGYSDQDQSGFWSNEVRSVAVSEFTVKTGKGLKEVGLYKDLDMRKWGAKYAKSVYIAYKEGSEWVIGNFKASGAALTAWIELSRRYKVDHGKCAIMGSQEATKGATKYHVPVFEWTAVDKADDEIALNLDKELQVYLDQYLTAAKSDRASNGEWDDGGPLPAEEEIMDEQDLMV